MQDTENVYSLTDFLKNHKAHMARLKETKTAEILTVRGRPEAVLLDPESYQNLLDRQHHEEAISAVRAVIRAANSATPHEEVTEAEIERSQAVVTELMAETERLGLYR